MLLIQNKQNQTEEESFNRGHYMNITFLICACERERVSVRTQHKAKEWRKRELEGGGVTYRKAIKGETGCVVVYLGFLPAGYVFSDLQ